MLLGNSTHTSQQLSRLDMRKFLIIVWGGLILPVCAGLTAKSLAVESWVEVTVNAAGDRTLVDQNSIQRSEDEVRYWEYRDMRQSGAGSGNRSGLSNGQPVYGMMIYRSVTCDSGESRMQRLVLFNQNREVIRRVNYEDSGGLTQPSIGSSSEAVIDYVCQEPKQEAEANQSSPEQNVSPEATPSPTEPDNQNSPDRLNQDNPRDLRPNRRSGAG
jgi:hypothetical protein